VKQKKTVNILDCDESDVGLYSLRIVLSSIPPKMLSFLSLHTRVLKECADVLALPLWIGLLFTSSLEASYVPSAWRKVKVRPIFKKGSRTEVSNYRPVSLTLVCCKTVEKLVRNSLQQHMISNGFLADTQHGFVHGRSCTTQLLRVLDAVT